MMMSLAAFGKWKKIRKYFCFLPSGLICVVLLSPKHVIGTGCGFQFSKAEVFGKSGNFLAEACRNYNVGARELTHISL